MGYREETDGGDDEGLFGTDRLEDFDLDVFLEQSVEEEWLERELERIDQQLERRDEIHEKNVSELEWKLDWYTDRLEQLYKEGRGKRDGKRERLRNRIEQFYEELRDERQQHWRDTQQLEEERRAILRELDRSTSDYLGED